MEKITGKNNELIKDVKKLLSSSGERKAQGVFVLEGARLVFDVLNSLYKVKIFLVTENAVNKYPEKCSLLIAESEISYMISDEVAAKLSDTKTPQGIFAVCYMKTGSDDIISHNGKYIALDNVQDPANLGAIVRSGEALGIDGIIVGGGCDMYNPKALRASMGSMLRVRLMQTDKLASVLNAAKRNGHTVFATTPDSSAEKITDIDFSNGGICVIGNEANGVSDEIFALSDRKITIPMLGRAESLNASVAASITMWEMLR